MPQPVDDFGGYGSECEAGCFPDAAHDDYPAEFLDREIFSIGKGVEK